MSESYWQEFKIQILFGGRSEELFGIIQRTQILSFIRAATLGTDTFVNYGGKTLGYEIFA